MNCYFHIPALHHTVLRGILLKSKKGSLVSIRFVLQKDPLPIESGKPNALLLHAKEQILAYFAGTLRNFDLPVRPGGTPFQQNVWSAIANIPYASVIEYGQLARQIGKQGASRAIGQAANKNPLPLVIPCHRVVGKDGAMTGYASGLALKSHLLSHERGDILLNTML